MIDKFAGWLRTFAVGLALEIYHYLKAKITRLKLDSRHKDLEAELRDNEIKANEDLRTRDADSVIRSAIDRGRNS